MVGIFVFALAALGVGLIIKAITVIKEKSNRKKRKKYIEQRTDERKKHFSTMTIFSQYIDDLCDKCVTDIEKIVKETPSSVRSINYKCHLGDVGYTGGFGFNLGEHGFSPFEEKDIGSINALAEFISESAIKKALKTIKEKGICLDPSFRLSYRTKNYSSYNYVLVVHYHFTAENKEYQDLPKL